MRNKFLITAALIIIIIASIITTIYILSNKDKEEPKTNNEINGMKFVEDKTILKDTKVNNLDLTDISLVTKNDVSTFYAKITNNTQKEIKIDKLYVVFYENEEEQRSLAKSSLKLGPNESTMINIISDRDLSKITKIEYVVENK